MDISTVAQFAFATLLPVAACVLLFLLRRRTGLSKLPEMGWQTIVGVVFGAIAIFGTEAGIPLNGAMMNVRDAAPVAAGLLFGGPAGIIAAFIGAIERSLAVFWGVGEFTWLACSLGTLFAGVYAALLRKYMFEGHIPNLPMSFATGIVVEVLHLILVFVTHPDESTHAFDVVQACAIPMTLCVGLSTMLCSLVMMLLNKKPLVTPVAERNIARILHTRMLSGVVLAFILTVGFTAILQTNLSRSESESLLELGVEDVESDIVEASDANLLAITHRAASALHDVESATDEECVRLAKALDVAEVNVVNANGIIVASNIPEFVGFDMASGEQASEFLVLLPGGSKTQLAQGYQPITYDANVQRKYAGVVLRDGFVQVGYDSRSFLNDISAQVRASVKNRHVGQSGFFVVIDEAGNVTSTLEDASGNAADRLSEDASKAEPGRLFTTMFEGEECYAIYQAVEGYRVISLLPLEEANDSRDEAVLVMSFMEVLVFAALFLLIYAVIKRVVVRSIRKMNGQLGRITLGDLDVTVDVHESSELSSLSDDINKTVGVLKDSLMAVQSDLDMAAEIQSNSLPAMTLDIAGRGTFKLHASMEPAKEVGGDFYDFFMIDDDHLALVVADVSGKGVPAALFMMLSKTVIKMEALSGLAPDEVLDRANADLSEKNDDDMFTTAWLGVLEIPTGRLVYADAGHEKLAICRNGSWDLPPKPNGAVALAAFSQEDYAGLPDKYRFRVHEIWLEQGDAVFQYTDGVTEATDADDELFGEERLLQALRDAPSPDPEVLLPFVRERVGEFVKDAPQFDDLTMLGLLYTGKGSNAGAEAQDGV